MWVGACYLYNTCVVGTLHCVAMEFSFVNLIHKGGSLTKAKYPNKVWAP